MMKGIVFDLDMTLVNSSVAAEARSRRNWQEVYSLIPRFTLYEGLDEVFSYIRQRDYKVAIVSTAPGTYVGRVVRHFAIPCEIIVAYHDAKPIKPAPASMLRAAELLRFRPQEIVNFGDRAIDIQAGVAAGMKNVACMWGSSERENLQKMAQAGLCSLIGDAKHIISEIQQTNF